LLILAAALASVDSRTEARSAPATIKALLFFILHTPYLMVNDPYGAYFRGSGLINLMFMA
jgi:hypothetical protein